MARRVLGPASLAVVQAVRAALSPADRSLVVACSGGADSLALAFGAQQAARRDGLGCRAVVVDHGLQDGSAAVARQAAAQLSRLGYDDVRVVEVQVPRSSVQGPEGAARTARYAALRADAGEPDASPAPATVLLGHTRDDQAESVLLGLLRGSGTRSLAGMAVRTGPYLRPLLDLGRATTVAACAELRLTPWTDPQNADLAFTRVRVRSVLPLLEDELGPGVAAALARTARLARDDADLLDEQAAAADPGTDTLDCVGTAALPAALRRRVLRRWLLRQGADEVGLGHVLAVEELLHRWHGQRGVAVPGGAVARSQGRLLWQAVARG